MYDAIVRRIMERKNCSGKKCGEEDPEVRELAALIERNKLLLYQSLDKVQREHFEKYIDCSEEHSYLISVHAFTDGFRLASRLLTDSLADRT